MSSSVPVAARGAVARGVPGMASNVLPLRLAVHPGMTVGELVEQASAQVRLGLEHQRYQLTDMRRDAGGEADGRTLFGLSVNVMAFDYGLKFAKSPAIAHNLSLGPVEDLSISVYDRADGEPLGSTSMSIHRCTARPISKAIATGFCFC